jgi:hypothetical protein
VLDWGINLIVHELEAGRMVCSTAQRSRGCDNPARPKNPGFIVLFMLVGMMAGLGSLSCADEVVRPTDWPDGALLPDGSYYFDGRAHDLGASPDLVRTTEGPTIQILAPTAGQTVTGQLLVVRAKITDTDGVEAQTIMVTLQGRSGVKMVIAGDNPDEYVAQVSVGSFTDKIRLWVSATDLLGNQNHSDEIDFQRDPGPVITFQEPQEGSYHRGKVSIVVSVADPVTLKSFGIRIGGHDVTLTQKDLGNNTFLYTGEVTFDDPVFGTPLGGQQVLLATAENSNGAIAIEQQPFFVDNEGPSISITSHSAGILIGNIVQISAKVSDPAGVLPDSVKAIVGNEFDNRQVALQPSPTTPGTYEGQFDARNLHYTHVWPVLSVRATDTLLNEGHTDIEVGLDNGPPILELDPPQPGAVDPKHGVYYFKLKDGITQCSHPFDPVGEDAANDETAASQLTTIRVRVEDQGNIPSTNFWVPVAGLDSSKSWLYVLAGEWNKPLVVDTTGDGYCDAINPEVIPVGAQPAAGEAVAVNLAGIPVKGAADFRPYDPPGVFPGGYGCTNGTTNTVPTKLCKTVPMTVAMYAHNDATAPAIYTIPPVVSGDDFKCAGIPFDFKANNFKDQQWTCVSASMPDLLGNVGIAPPIRLWVDYSDTVGGGTPPAGAGQAPHCTGTVDAAGTVTNTACKFRGPDPTPHIAEGLKVPFAQTYSNIRLKEAP